MFVRDMKFSGRFYPENPRALIAMLQDLFYRADTVHKKLSVRGTIMPHAAYHYSGQVAMSVLKCIEIPENIIIFAPNHSGLGGDVNIVCEGRFITPIGDVSVNSEIAKTITSNINLVKEDIKSHIIEHSIEVQLPMLKYMRNDIKVVPIIIKRLQPDLLTELTNRLIDLFKDTKGDSIFLSTSDLSHYESYKDTIRKDRLLLNYLEQMDSAGLGKVIAEEKISMCGYECVAININLCRMLGATKGIIKRYDTSSSFDGNYENVVGYAGICFV